MRTADRLSVAGPGGEQAGAALPRPPRDLFGPELLTRGEPRSGRGARREAELTVLHRGGVQPRSALSARCRDSPLADGKPSPSSFLALATREGSRGRKPLIRWNLPHENRAAPRRLVKDFWVKGGRSSSRKGEISASTLTRPGCGGPPRPISRYQPGSHQPKRSNEPLVALERNTH